MPCTHVTGSSGQGIVGMEKLLRRELVYSVSETSLWGQFLLSLKKLKFEVRGRAADNPPEVDMQIAHG